MAVERFFAVEHALMMIIAWLLVHLGRSMVKRSDNDAQKHKRSLIYFGIAILIILAMIPWPFKQALVLQGNGFPSFNIKQLQLLNGSKEKTTTRYFNYQ